MHNNQSAVSKVGARINASVFFSIYVVNKKSRAQNVSVSYCTSVVHIALFFKFEIETLVHYLS